jgi:hypothetical protein
MSNWYKTLSEDIDARNIGPHAINALRETRYIEGLIEGKNRQDSATDAGYPGRMAHAPTKLIESSELRAQFQEIVKAKGLSLHRVADKISEHLEAREGD